MATRRKYIGHHLQDWYDGPERGGYVHIINLGGLPSRGRIAVAEGIVFRRASSRQIRSIRALHKHHGLFEPRGSLFPRNPFETIIRKTGRSAETVSSLPSTMQPYYAIEYVGFNPALHAFLESTALTPWPLEYGATIHDENFTDGRGIGFGFSLNVKALGRFVESASFEEKPFTILDQSAIQELGSVYMSYRSHDNSLLDLGSPVKRYWDLMAIPDRSDMRLLGYFSILESLLTHKPDPKDPTDSLTRQIRSKMSLLDARFRRPLPYAERLGVTDPGKVWAALYDLRSVVAHGTSPDFRTGTLKKLKNMEAARELAHLAVVATMRQALQEPRLVRDLKNC